MRKISTEVLVIGGGATGAGVARDLAMRGFTTTLVERGDLTQGTTGRYHGLLHSGARYVVRDPLAAKECIEENRILRRIMPQCIEDTGGFFVLTPWDDPSYVSQFVQGCAAAGIPCEELPISQMLRAEPSLNPHILRCFRVPDGSADSFLATEANVASARTYGAQVLTYHQVIRLLGTDHRVTGALVHDLIKDEEVQIDADAVVNAAGAWVGHIARTLGVQIRIVPGKGTMLAVNHRIVNTVINRCRVCGDADILVPAHTVAVIGTTDIPVKDPDRLAIEEWEIQLMLEEGEKLVPGFKNLRMLRAWAGVRPLYRESDKQDVAAESGNQAPGNQADNRLMPRSFVLLDHETRDGLAGLITITSGKWTTYRKMAEAAVDLVCAKLGVNRPCRTHLEPLPGADHSSGVRYHRLGSPLARVEHPTSASHPLYGRLICECELATMDDVRHAILQGNVQTIDDVRRDVRLGMGPCQGGFCTLRVAGMLYHLRQVHVEAINASLHDFLQERWKGLLPILWGQQLRQERLNELIYRSVLNAGNLPGPRASRLAPILYEPDKKDSRKPTHQQAEEQGNQLTFPLPRSPAPAQAGSAAPELDILIIGAGLAGLTAAWRLGKRGLKARLIAKGWGALYWNAGCIDVLGFSPSDPHTEVVSPAQSLTQLVDQRPDHPYAQAGIENLDVALRQFQDLCTQAGYPLHGSLERNWRLPTALGSLRPTCLAPETMIAGDMRKDEPMLIVGFEPYLDFYPQFIASNLEKSGVAARGVLLDLPGLKKQRFVSTRTLAQLFESQEFREQVSAALKPHLRNHAGTWQAARVGFPAVLGLDHTLYVHHDLQNKLGLPVFEIPTLPPSIPGLRLHNLLVEAIKKNGGRIFEGMQVTGAETENRRVLRVWSQAAARPRAHAARNFILATGGILGGGLTTTWNGFTKEIVLNLPVRAPQNRASWLAMELLSPTGHPIFQAGIPVNSSFQPVDESGQALYDNLWVAGAALANCDPVWERSVEGIALATGFLVGERLIPGERRS